MKKNHLFLLITIILFLTSGCSNYLELNQVGVIIGVGIDKNDDPNQPYRVTYQVLNPSGLAQGTSSADTGLAVVNYTVTGGTLLETSRKASSIIPRRSTLTHMSLVVVSEKLARKDLDSLFDTLDRSKQGRTSLPVFIARGSTAEHVLNGVEPFEINPVKSIISTSENNQKLYGVSNNVLVYDAISALSSKGKDLAIPGINIHNDSPESSQASNLEKTNPSVIEVNGLGMFKEGKLVRWLDGEKARAVQFITSDINSTVVPIQCKQGNIGLGINRVKSEIKTDVRQNEPIIYLNSTMTGEILESSCAVDLTDPDLLNRYEKRFEKEITKQIKQTIAVAQKEKSDIFGFGNSLARTHPTYWHKHQDNWRNLFSNAKTSIKVNVNITNTGMRTNSYEAE
ncbi:Ger(x)C family spore germination protein [Priestia flexa]|uniref:Ger(x)C family spore germination protein n=1 Tax=Priestia flexa TaxID=86664 RepID=UPI001B34362F|nr:Ger(x)C family spore germination protein [Priestia flexa]